MAVSSHDEADIAIHPIRIPLPPIYEDKDRDGRERQDITIDGTTIG